MKEAEAVKPKNEVRRTEPQEAQPPATTPIIEPVRLVPIDPASISLDLRK